MFDVAPKLERSLHRLRLCLGSCRDQQNSLAWLLGNQSKPAGAVEWLRLKQRKHLIINLRMQHAALLRWKYEVAVHRSPLLGVKLKARFGGHRLRRRFNSAGMRALIVLALREEDAHAALLLGLLHAWRQDAFELVT